jgi:hypothetical protein
VFIYALMASGGDMGAAVVPQLLGIITDAAAANPALASLAADLGLAPEQLGMRLGMLVGVLFPVMGVVVYTYLVKTRRSYRES